MKRRLISLLLILTLILPASITVHAEGGSIVVLYTNDVHCAIDDYAVLAAYKAELVANGNTVITVDAGDAIQGEVIGTQTEGSAVVDIMNTVGYDYAVPGNHEFDYGMDVFLNIANNEANYEYLSSNFYFLPELAPVLKPYAIQTVNGKKIAFVGISTPETISKSTPTYFKDENGNFIYGFPTFNMEDGVLYEVIQESVNNAITDGADIVIAIGHLGVLETTDGWKSTDVIANTTGIDFFIDAHSHETVEGATYKNKNGDDVIMSSTGSKFANFGALTIDGDGNASFSLIDPDTVNVDAMSDSGKAAYNAVKAKVDGYNAQIEELFGKIGSSEANLVVSDDNGWLVRRQETNMGDFVTDAYRAVTGADIAICNGGGVRSAIAIGDVSKKLLMDVNPWSNAMCVVEVTGLQLLQVLEHGARSCPEPLGGFFQISGASYEIHTYNESPVMTDQNGNFTGIDSSKPARVQNVLVNGEPLNLEKTYTVASSQYVLTEGGDGLTMLDGAKIVAKDGLLCDSEMLIKYFAETLNGTIPADKYANPNGEGRIVIYEHAGNRINPGETVTIDVSDSEDKTVVVFVPETSGDYVFESLVRSAIDPFCDLYVEGNDEVLASSDDEIVFDFRIEYYFEAGKTYYFKCGIYAGNEAIKITLNCDHSFENGVCTVCDEECDHEGDLYLGYCSCGSTYNGEDIEDGIDYKQEIGADGKFGIFRFVPKATGFYRMTSGDSTGDPVVFVFDENGDLYCFVDDIEGEPWFDHEFMFVEGKQYYLYLGNYNPDTSYTFTITDMNCVIGDVNGDGEVSNLDAAQVLKYDAGLIDMDDSTLLLADFNFDGEVNNIDAAVILGYDAGVIDWDDIL